MELTLPRYTLPMDRYTNIHFVDPEPESYGDYLRRTRIERGWSQAELAERVSAILTQDLGGKGITQGMISSYEVGNTKQPHPTIAAAIDDVFGQPRGTLAYKAEKYGRGGRRPIENAVVPGDIHVHKPNPGLRRIWEYIKELLEGPDPERAQREIEHSLVQMRVQDSQAKKPRGTKQPRTEGGAKETGA